MMYKIVDSTAEKISDQYKDLLHSFMEFTEKNLSYDKPVVIHFISDGENAKNPLARTGGYDPVNMQIIIYTSGRHIKDILRSLSHELIHHLQNCEGKINHDSNTETGYAQKDMKMRELEIDAYKHGNIMNFRDFEDNYKDKGLKKIKMRIKK
tara:strand:- start:436 stop:891 length:456 start_codon:yes stop_codon:yes gene_type:complete